MKNLLKKGIIENIQKHLQDQYHVTKWLSLFDNLMLSKA